MKDIRKVIVIGDNGAGKSSIVSRLSDDVFPAVHPFLGTQFKVIPPNDQGCTLQVWDFGSSQVFRQVRMIYYEGAHLVIIVFDISDRTSYESVPKWLSEVSDSKVDMNNCVLMVVGNKNDKTGQR